MGAPKSVVRLTLSRGGGGKFDVSVRRGAFMAPGSTVTPSMPSRYRHTRARSC